MNRMSKRGREQVKNRITKLRKAIRKKYRKFKLGEMETVRDLEKQYKPIISELKKIEPNRNDSSSSSGVKKEPADIFKEDNEQEAFDDDMFEPPVYSSPKQEERTLVESLAQDDEDIYGDAADDYDDDDEMADVSSILSTDEGQETASQYVYRQFQNPVTRHYMQILMSGVMKGSRDPVDHTYGPRFDGDILKIGDQAVQFDEEGRIVIDGIKYKGTEGLYELIFKRSPDDKLYTEQDKTAYKEILKKTNAHKKNYSPSAPVNRNSSNKYRLVISELFPPLPRHVTSTFGIAKGSGLTTKTLKGPDISYWDDPNELVDRLQILVAAARAGNTGVKNEILNILEELKEAKLISGRGNVAFQSLLK